MSLEIFRLFGSVLVDNTEADKSIAKTDGNAESLGVRFSAMAKTAAKWGLAIGSALAGVAVASGKMAVDFEKDMSNVGTLLGAEGSDRVKELGSDVKRLAAETGKPLSDLAGGLYQVVSAFGDGADSAKILDIAARGSSAGLATTEDAVNLLSAVTKGYGDTSATAVGKVSDMAFQTVKLGQTDFPQLASAIGKVVPLAAELGATQEELFGVMATATGVTGGASEVATQLRGVMQSLMAPTANMTGLYENMGFASGKAMLEQLGLQGSINAIVGAANESGVPLGKYLSSIEGQTLALALAGPQADVFSEKLAAMGDAAGQTDEAFKIQQATVSASMDKIKQSVAVVGVELGERFLPILQRMMDWVVANLPQIQAFFETTFNAAGAVIGWVSDNIIPALVMAFVFLRDDVLPPLIAVIEFITQTVIPGIIDAFNWARDTVIAVGETMKVVWDKIGDTVTVIAAIITGLFLPAMLKMGYTATIEGFKVVTSWVLMGKAAIKEVAISVYQMGVMAVKYAWLGVQSMIHAAKIAGSWLVAMGPLAWVTAAVLGLVALIVMNWDTIKETTVRVWASITSGVTGAIDSMIGPIRGFFDMIGGAINKVKEFFGAKNSAESAASSMKIPAMPSLGNLPGLASGGDVMGAGLALVGERGPELLHLPRGARVEPLDRRNDDRPIELYLTVQSVLNGQIVAEEVLHQIIPSIRQAVRTS